MTEAQLNGMLRSDFARPAQGRVPIRIREPTAGGVPWGSAPLTQVTDARPLQAEAASEAAFFAQHNFALLPHKSAVTDWVTDQSNPSPDSEVARFYVPEVEALIRERLLPGVPVVIFQRPALVRRGPDAEGYAPAVHQDFGLTADDYQEGVGAFAGPEIGQRWRDGYDKPEVAGFMVIDFWRPIDIAGPLRHMPLAVCDPASVEAEDVTPSSLLDFSPTGRPTNQLSLRYNPSQRWYYYPEMTTEEVLCFKLFHCLKSDAEPHLRTCFHTAFVDPSAPADAEPRRSCEHRVGVFLLRTS